MSLNAFAIMLKPFLAKYLEPLEEDGTIAKLQADIALVAKENAIPELAKLVANLERNNALLESIEKLLKESPNECPEPEYAGSTVEPRSDPNATRLVGDNWDGVSDISGAD